MTFTRRTLFKTGLAVTAVGVGLPAAASAAEINAPVIDSTAVWGARPPSSPIQVIDSKPVKILVHHTASANTTDYSRAQAHSLSRSIQNFHMDSRGWIDTGQHFTNSRGGYVTEGRHRSLEVLQGRTRHVVSAHASGQNTVSLGIENEGLYTSVGPTVALWNSLVSLCKYMCAQYGINPREIYGHRDFNNTECPGNVLYARLPELRTAVGAASAQQTSWPLLKPGDTGPRVLAAQHLLRAHGAHDLPADGVFGSSTAAAARRFAESRGVTTEQCYGTAFVDESSLLGAGSWPLLVKTVHSDDTSDFGRAARALTYGRSTAQVIDTNTWRTLLNG
jgi:hypothetical protein